MIYRDVTYVEFQKEVENKKIICAGGGQMFFDMCNLWEEAIIKKIEFVVDEHKMEKEIHYLNYDFKVLKTDELNKIDMTNSVILITSMYCMSIFNQINKILKEKNVFCYSYPVMSLRNESYLIPKKNREQQIPKIIHYFWFGKGRIPCENQKCIDSWRKYCPDYEIKLWNEENYDVSKNEYMKQAYESEKWGFVPDYARLDIIYQYGGIYLDTDVEICKSLDELLYQNVFMGFQRNFRINLGLGFGAGKENYLIKEMRDEYEKYHFVNKNGSLNLTAAPIYQTDYLKKMGLKCNNTMQYVDEILILPNNAMDPQGVPYGKVQKKENTFSIHHYSESWVDDIQKGKNKLMYEEVIQMLSMNN